MSDYSQATDFSAKDVLTAGDPNKAIQGAHLDVELGLIAAAILTKYDSGDLAIASEATAGTNNTKLMTPLRVQNWYDNLAATSVAKYKDAAETVSSSTTLQSDDDLASWTIAASGVYRVYGILHCSIKAASDLKLGLIIPDAPTSMVIKFSGVGATTAALTRAVQTSNETPVSLTTTSDEDMVIVVDGLIRNDANATTATLQWAQNASVAENLVMNIGSFLVLDKIA